MNQDLEALCQLVEDQWGVHATLVRETHVKEVWEGKTVWEGPVWEFDIKGQPEATRCYAWAFSEGKVLFALHLPPVDGPLTAVRVGLVKALQQE